MPFRISPRRHAIIACSALLLPAVVQATPLDITFAGQFRDIRGPNSVNFSQGDRHLLDVIVNSSGGGNAPADTVVTATNGTTTFNLGRTFDISNEFFRNRSFGSMATSPWTFTASSGLDSVTATSHDITSVTPLPFVRNVRMLEDALTPTVFWDLPTGGPPNDIDRLRNGLFNHDTDARIPFANTQLFQTLAPDATSYTFAPGDLEEGVNYTFRVILEEVDQGPTNRATSFFNFTTDILGGDTGPVYLPTVTASGEMKFDFDVQSGEAFLIDPFFATGYIFNTGDGDPNFASVQLPDIGDGEFLLSFFDDVGVLVENLLLAGQEFLFPTSGVDSFTVTGIEVSAMLDQADPTAFVNTVSFVEDGVFTGSMTPITTFVSEVSSPSSLLLAFPLALVAAGRRRRAG
jgi:hypothetical protein